MSIPPKFLDELRARLSLSDIVGKRIKLVRAGREFKACCPFHHEKTPSFTVNDAKGFYYCFGCGAKGDVLNFVMKHDNLEFMPAVELLAAEAGMAVPRDVPRNIVREKKQKDLYEMMDEAAQWFEACLHEPRQADVLAYVRRRGLTAETLKGFRIGFAPDDYESLKTALKDKGYTEAQMLDAGLLKKSERDGKTYSFFRGRVMVPVLDMKGRVVAFGGRVLPEHMRPPERGDFTPPKYINSPETSIFHKSSVLYGGYVARGAAGHGKELVVVEGYFDVIASHQAGFTGAVAPMGTALTEEQVSLLWKMIPAESGQVKEPILCFDGDNAGRRAAERACRLILPLLSSGQSARFAFLPDGEDPDTLIAAAGAGSFQKVLDSALPLFDFLWALHTGGRSFKTPDSRAALIKALNEDIAQIPDGALQRQYDTLMRDRIYKAFAPQRGGGYGGYQGRGGYSAKGNSAAMSGSRASLPAPLPLGRILLAALLNYPGLLGDFEEALWQLPLTDHGDDALRRALVDYASRGDVPLDTEALHTHIKQAGLTEELENVLCARIYTHAAFCRPGGEEHSVRETWQQIWADMQRRGILREVRSGWHDAVVKGDAEEENRFRLLKLESAKRDENTGTY